MGIYIDAVALCQVGVRSLSVCEYVELCYFGALSSLVRVEFNYIY